MNRDLAHQSIAVIGYGITGRACVRFLLSLQAKVCVLDADPNIRERVSDELPSRVFSSEMSLSDFDLVVISPGVNPHQACFEKYKQSCGKVIGDIELFSWFNNTPLIGITGSNGKTTVTDMLGNVLSKAGLNVELAGNYGKCAVDVLLEAPSREKPLDVIVLELSSYQLEMTTSLALEFATVLNITEDHLDRHGSFKAYKMAKQRIFNMAKHIIVNRDEALSFPNTASHNNNQQQICAEVGSNAHQTHYGIARSTAGKDMLRFGGVDVLALSDLQLTGAHNYINAMIVLALCDQLSLERELTVPAIANYAGLPHRFETIQSSTLVFNGKSKQVTWINDSKATNIGACQAALACFAGTNEYVILIAGGDAKGVDLFPLKESIESHVQGLIVLGKDALKFKALVPEAIHVTTMAAAVAQAIELIAQSDAANCTVLLSPACASIDMFSNYQQRGDVFSAAVREQVA